VVAIIAAEPKTVFPVIPSHDNLMCSMQAKLPVFGSYLEGKMPANAIVLGASHPQLREEPPKRPPSDVGCLGTALDVSGYLDAIFLQNFSAFPAISLP
jgi:hypothetical protein